MRRAPLFAGLTRPVSVMGLPMTYMTMLFFVVFGGFIATLSFIYLALSAIAGYAALRWLASIDPRLIDVMFAAAQRTPVPVRFFKKGGISYGA